ncbi:hypothetical protein J7412_12905 [Shimia sp. R9_3]|nr:hypothetical protein [Shimia sp. R9_3]
MSEKIAARRCFYTSVGGMTTFGSIKHQGLISAKRGARYLNLVKKQYIKAQQILHPKNVEDFLL